MHLLTYKIIYRKDAYISGIKWFKYYEVLFPFKQLELEILLRKNMMKTNVFIFLILFKINKIYFKSDNKK